NRHNCRSLHKLGGIPQDVADGDTLELRIWHNQGNTLMCAIYATSLIAAFSGHGLGVDFDAPSCEVDDPILGDTRLGIFAEILGLVVDVGTAGNFYEQGNVGRFGAVAAAGEFRVGAAEDDEVGLGSEAFAEVDGLRRVDRPLGFGEPRLQEFAEVL